MRTYNGKVDLVCQACGTSFWRYRSQIREGHKIFCSNECRKRPVEERFWEKVNKNGPIPTNCPELGPCWQWTGCLNKDGYGHFDKHGNEQRSNRLAWLFTKGPIPDGMLVLHKCLKNPGCCNPDHLKLGTQSDNMQDAIRDGTFFVPVGVETPGAILNDDAVRDIRANYRRGNVKVLAEKYHTSIYAIRDAAKGRTWQHVKTEIPTDQRAASK